MVFSRIPRSFKAKKVFGRSNSKKATSGRVSGIKVKVIALFEDII